MNIRSSKSNLIFFVNTISIILLLIVIGSFQFGTEGPDASLYRGIAQNLVEGIGFYDTVRHDEILPPIGHPFLLSLFLFLDINPIAYSYLTIALSIIIFILIGRLIFQKTYVFVGFLFLLPFWFYDYSKIFRSCGIEFSLLFSVLFFWFSVMLLYKNRNNENNRNSSLFIMSIAMFVFIMIRPLLLPALYLFVLFFLGVLFFKGTYKFLLKPVTFLAVGVFFIFIFSKLKYNDSRLLTGTYSSITLYCSFNKYIKLDEPYNEVQWNKYVTPEIVKKDMSFLINYDDWVDRDKKIKKQIKKFICENPLKAMKGYLWRLSRFTLGSKLIIYKMVFLSWLISSVFSMIFLYRTGSFLWALSYFLLVSYIILLQALFPFVGVRYYLVPLLFMGLSFLGNIQLCLERNIDRKIFLV